MPLNGIQANADPPTRETIHPAKPPLTRRQKLRLVIKVVELRLRFVALMALTGLVFAYWDTIWNRYEKRMRPAADYQGVMLGHEFYCPMHPQVVQDELGSCPICGMTLAKRKTGDKPVMPMGVTARVQLNPSRIAQAGIKTVDVEYAALAQVLTTVGYVAFDERKMASIVSKVPGQTRVERLYVDVTGQNVEAGQPLAELYSPELSQAIHELLIVARRAAPAVEPQTEVARSLVNDRRDMVRAAAEKLKRWGITQPQIEEILAKGKTDFTFPILSPTSGHINKKNVVAGQEVPEGFPMFEVIDLGTVWVLAQVYEHQLGMIHEGQAAAATVEAFPGESFSGKLEFIQPHLDPATRAVEVRYTVENPDHRLRPGMFATVTLTTQFGSMPAFQARSIRSETRGAGATIQRATVKAEDQRNCPVTSAKLGSMGDPVSVQIEGRKVWTCCAACPPKLRAQPAKFLARLVLPPRDQVLSVPESAVVDTGTRKVVYIEAEPGVFEGRDVVLGPRAGDRFPVLDGLFPGDKVAAAGAFLIDAESRLNPGAADARAAGAPAHADGAQAASESPSTSSSQVH